MCYMCDCNHPESEADLMNSLNKLSHHVCRGEIAAIECFLDLSLAWGVQMTLDRTKLSYQWAGLSEGLKFRSLFEQWSWNQISDACSGKEIPEHQFDSVGLYLC
jgi:hypothetical protein